MDDYLYLLPFSLAAKLHLFKKGLSRCKVTDFLLGISHCIFLVTYFLLRVSHCLFLIDLFFAYV